MKKIYSAICFRQIKHTTSFAVFLLLLSLGTAAQNRNFGIVYSENLKGGSALFGNTLMNLTNPDGTPNVTAMNGNSANGNSIYDNGNFNTSNMRYIDIDGNTGEGAGTINSSSADLVLPAGTNTIKFARLYWGGRVAAAQFDITQAVNQRIKIRKGTTGAYQEYAAAQLDRIIQNPGLSTEFSLYQAYIDITPLVQQEGAGTYTVGNGTFSTGPGGDFGNYGAWSIVVVYENPLLNFNSVRIFDGYQQIYNGGSATTSTITLSGLNVPSGALVSTDAVLGIMGWEGDARYNGDFFRINGSIFSNGLNQADNPWNGTNTDNGVHVTTKNPNYTDQMGIDIDHFNVGTGYGILPNASSVTLQFGTTQDQYFCGVVSFVIRMKDPIIKIVKTVTDANNNQAAEGGEILTYTLKGKNVGIGNANAVVLTDSLPTTLAFVPGSLTVNYSPGITTGAKTDAAADDIAEYNAGTKMVTFRLGTGATATAGGSLAFADSFEVAFQVMVNMPANGVVTPITNVARLIAKSDALVDYVDDGSVVINAQNSGPLPVSLTSFTASLQPNKLVKVAWSTSMEINSARFDIERSTDGVAFKTVATKAGSGNSSVQIAYSINDDVTSITAPIVYYRLKQVDINGKTTVSRVASVKLKKTIGDFTVSPNPFRNTLNINIEWDKNETTVVKVFNVTGSEVVSKSVQMIRGFNYVSIDELSQVPPGNYVIQFNGPNGKLIKQVVKQK
ncbi:MAG: T9SS type A sorting domain-containing protein [Ferruginibacter sp.]